MDRVNRADRAIIKASVPNHVFQIGALVWRKVMILLGKRETANLMRACHRFRAIAFIISELTTTTFWEKVKNIPPAPTDGRYMVDGKIVFLPMDLVKRDIALACNVTSEYVRTYLHSAVPGTVLDLGCGIGSNSLYLLEHGWRVIAIDKQPEVVRQYANKVQSASTDRPKLTLAIADITNYHFPQNVDAVICVDVWMISLILTA